MTIIIHNIQLPVITFTQLCCLYTLSAHTIMVDLPINIIEVDCCIYFENIQLNRFDVGWLIIIFIIEIWAIRKSSHATWYSVMQSRTESICMFEQIMGYSDFQIKCLMFLYELYIYILHLLFKPNWKYTQESHEHWHFPCNRLTSTSEHIPYSWYALLSCIHVFDLIVVIVAVGHIAIHYGVRPLDCGAFERRTFDMLCLFVLSDMRAIRVLMSGASYRICWRSTTRIEAEDQNAHV